MGVSDRGAETPIKKFKTISHCPNQGSLSVAFTNASVLGRCDTVRSQPAASVAVCACAWGKKRKPTKTKPTNQLPQPVDRSAEQTQPAAERLPPAPRGAVPRAGAVRREAARSTKPGLTLTPDPCYAPRALPATPERAPSASRRGAAQPGTPFAAAGVTVRVCGERSTNLPAVLRYLNVSELSTVNVRKYLSLQTLWFTGRQPVYVYVFVYIHTRMWVCGQRHKHNRVCIYVFSFNT